MYGYIYCTINLINGMIYIGQKHSNTFLGTKYLGSGKRLKEAINKYGKNNFNVALVEEIETKEEMDEREIYWISYYNTTDKHIGYNLSKGGNVNRTLVGENNGFYGKKHSDESRAKMSRSQHERTDDRSHTQETKDKISKKLTGRKIMWADKISANAKINDNYGMKNKHLSDDTKDKLSKIRSEYFSNDENRQHQSECVKSSWANQVYRENHIIGMRGKKHAINYKKCWRCGRLISASNLKRHRKTHYKNKRLNINIKKYSYNIQCFHFRTLISRVK